MSGLTSPAAVVLSHAIGKATALELMHLNTEMAFTHARRLVTEQDMRELAEQWEARLKAMPTPEQYRAVLGRVPIHEFGLDRRTVNVLTNSHLCIFYASQLLDLTEQDILDARNAGTKTLESVKAALHTFGLTLKSGGGQ